MTGRTDLQDLLQTLYSAWPTLKYYFTGVAIFTVIELIYPAERGQPWTDKAMSVAFSVIQVVITPFLILLPMHYVAEPLFRLAGHPLIDLNLDQYAGTGPTGWALRNLVFPFAPILVLDFFYYWTHRLQHTFPALWAQHKLHHSERSLCAATNFRHHWLEELIRIFTMWIPMGILIKVNGGAGAILAPFIAYWGFFIHTNARIPLGPLTRVIAGPQVHRIHHSMHREHYDKNFAAFFPLWDIVFGTYCHPKQGEWPATGLEDCDSVRSIWHGFIMPIDGPLKRVRQKIERQPARRSN
jgi:sterol desaturase/sphingolipid hydroxylase (fatty acid hydroxylase superfamily)